MKRQASTKILDPSPLESTSGRRYPESTPANRWTFLTNHAHVLILIYSDPDMILRQIAQIVGITERAVQRIVHELEEEGYLVRERVGRRNHYSVVLDRPLRHPVEANHSIGELLRLLGCEQNS